MQRAQPLGGPGPHRMDNDQGPVTPAASGYPLASSVVSQVSHSSSSAFAPVAVVHLQHQPQHISEEPRSDAESDTEEHARWLAYQAARQYSGECHGYYYTRPTSSDLLPSAAVDAHGPQLEPSVGASLNPAGNASDASRRERGSYEGGSTYPAAAENHHNQSKSTQPPSSSAVWPSADGEFQVVDLESPDVTPDASGGTPGDSKAAGDASLLTTISESAQLMLQFTDICGWVPAMVQQPSLLKRLVKAATASCSNDRPAKPKERQIMFNLTGEVHPGEVLALMGPSGSGKTSLLSVLGGRASKSVRLSGRVLVNDEPFSKATRRRIGFVLQDDVLYEDLTVYETLSYAALLRLPRSLSRKQKLERVEQVIEALGVRKSRNTIIGGFFRRGISGGERKRVSIGHELLTNPAILMLDEPTSGLDSTTALHLLQLLEDLAAGGRSIATTIHQPSGRLYQKLDKLMLLAEGHMMYYGKAQEVLQWFGRFGYQIPFGINVADYILDIAMGEAGYSNTGNTGPAAISELYSAFEACTKKMGTLRREGFSALFLTEGSCDTCFPGGTSDSTSDTTGDAADQVPAGNAARAQHLTVGAPAALGAAGRKAGGGGGALPMSMPAAAAGGVERQGPSATAAAAAHGKPAGAPSMLEVEGGGGGKQGQHAGPARRDGAPYWMQVTTLLQRASRVRRFEQLTAQHFTTLFAVAFVTGLVWWQRGQNYTLAAASDKLGLLFFMLLFPAMRALFHALFTFPNEYRMIMKERPTGMYKLSAYYLARSAADVPVELLNTVLFVIVTYWFGGLQRDAGCFFGTMFGLLLVVLVAEAWGLLVGAVFQNPKDGQSFTTIVILTFLLVGGYYVRNIPVWISWLRFLSFLYWGYNILLKSQFGGTTYYDCSSSQPDGSCTPVTDLKAALSLVDDPNDSSYRDVLVLLGMWIALRLIVYYVLRRKTRTRQVL